MTTQDKIEAILIQNPEARDNDSYLVGIYWYVEKKEFFNKGATALDFLKLFKEGKFTSHDLITRYRRKLQEQNIHLRGKSYAKRKKYADKFKESI